MRIKAYLRACINTHSSRAGGDHKRKRPKIVMSPKAQGLMSNTHHGKKHMLQNCTHDRMSGGKAVKRSHSGATAKKRRFRMRQITQLYLSPLRKTIPVGGFAPLRPKCHTTVVTPTKMQCCAMIIIDKGPNKGLLFHRCHQFGRLALTDRSVGHGRYRWSVRFHLRDNTVDINGWFGYTYGELRSISTVGSVHGTQKLVDIDHVGRFIQKKNRSTVDIDCRSRCTLEFLTHLL